MHLKSGTLLERGKYRIIATLGRGGFGVTYLAEQVMAKRRVCIKEFFPKDYYKRDGDSSNISLSSDGFAEVMNKFKTKFIKEAQTIAALDHTNIIPIHDVFEENGTAYYVMDYIEGEPLSELVKRNGAMSESDALKYIRQVASALEHIHEQQIMHLDVKPGNIMVRSKDNRAILIDFGLSKHYDATSGEVTSTTPVGVSHGYAPIEQYKQGGVSKFSPETDIYSLGATLYYLVTGSVPPQAADMGKDGIGELPSELSSGVCAAIRKSMNYWKEDRPHTIKYFLALLDNDEETKFPPPKPTQKRSRWWLWCLLLLFIVVLCISLKDIFRGGDNAKEVAKEEKRVEIPAEEVVLTPAESEIEVVIEEGVEECCEDCTKEPEIEEYGVCCEDCAPVPEIEEYGVCTGDEVSPETNAPYKIGDYYNKNGKEGVVFEVCDNGRHGKIVSLYEAKKQWRTYKQYKRRIALGITDENNGKENTDKVMQRSDSDQYPAFVWCRNKGADWYMPAKDELKAIYNNMSAINSTLAKYGTELRDAWYWSSTEHDEFCACIVNMNVGDTYIGDSPGDFYVRAVSVF